jgi:uncharacterized membrane protein YdjX (TVP38/TMEM64 family)
LLGFVTRIAPVLRDHPYAGPIICAAAFAVLGGVSLMPTYALSILCGWCFGFYIGFPAALAGIVAASVESYWIARHISGKRLLHIIDERPKWRAVHAALLARGFWRPVWIIALLRNSPVPPFGLTNLILGAAHVKPWRYFVGTALGMTPHAAALVLAAVGLRQVNFHAAEQPWIVIAGIVVMLVTVSVIGRLARRELDILARKDADSPIPDEPG